MAVILAYTSPAIGHLYPFCALLGELASRGHQIHVRTLESGVDLCHQLGFKAQAVDPRIEALQSDDWQSTSALRSADRTVDILVRRAVFEVDDLAEAIKQAAPGVVLIDANCWGAISAAEIQDVPWLVFSPFIPYFSAPGSPPFGPGYAPRSGWWGAIRDAGVGLVTTAIFDRPFRRGLGPLRAGLGLPPVRTAGALLLRAREVLVATGKPFEYPHTTWGDAVHLVGPAHFEPPQEPPDWLADIDLPVVLVTTSSVRQADSALVSTTLRALEGERVHVVATLPAAGDDTTFGVAAHATVTRFVPHSAVLEHAVCVVTHGGMGITQKALSRGVPVCVVPFGRDQFEVARRVEVAGCGTRIPARALTADRLRQSILTAMTMRDGAARVAAGFAATGGMSRGADLVESRLEEA